MKTLNLNQMETIDGGGCIGFNNEPECYVAAIGAGLSLFALFTGVGTLAGLSALASLAGALPTCFPSVPCE